MHTPQPLVIFTLEEQSYAAPLSAVERVVQLVDIVPLPKAPEIVLGVINLQGRILPAINLRRRFGLPERSVRLSDQCLIAHTLKRTVALVIDGVVGVLESSDQTVTTAEHVLPNLAYVTGVVKREDGMILIHDLDQLLSLDEETAVDQALLRDS
jgi:purine-binding chemotaxis protein CheW